MSKPEITLVLLVILLTLQPLMAEEILGSKASVLPGMGYHEVLEIWGAPEQKTEQETRRVDVWQYPDQLVHFKNGRVLKTEDLSTKMDSQLPIAEVVPSPKPRPQQPDDAQMEKILSEIIGSTSR